MNALLEDVELVTTIYSNGFASYRNIPMYGFSHAWVNHSLNFVSPDNQNVHTQTIERAWLGVKDDIPPGTRYEARIRDVAHHSFKRDIDW